MAFGVIIFFLFALGMYYLPFVICVQRDTDNQLGMFLINTILGWTVLVWVILLIVSVTSKKIVVRYG